MPDVERIQYAEDCSDDGHDECTAIIVARVVNTRSGREFHIESVSHAHRDRHLECRIGDAVPEVEDRRGGRRSGPKLRWRPQCDDCLVHFHGHHDEEARSRSVDAALAKGVITSADVQGGWD